MSKNKTFSRGHIMTEIGLLNYFFYESKNIFFLQPYNNSDKTPVATKFFHNKIARFQIQNFLIRLFSILQYFEVYKNFDDDKNPELSVLKDLRNKFGHTLGSYNKRTKDKKIMRKIIKAFKLENREYEDFPIYDYDILDAIVKASIQFVNEQYP